MAESAFPLDAEQIVRLTAAVVCELRQAPSTEPSENRLDAVMLRLADAVGLPLATEPAPTGPSRERPARPSPRGTSETYGLRVRPYPALDTDIQARVCRIEQECTLRQVSRRALCEALRIAPSTWTRWKAGRNSPTLATWARIERDAAAFLSEAGTPPPTQGKAA